MSQLPLFAPGTTAAEAVAAARAAGYSSLAMRAATLSAVPVLRAAQEAYRAWREAQPGDYQRAHPLWTPRLPSARGVTDADTP